MREPQMFRMAIGMLYGMLGFFSLHFLSPLIVLAQSTHSTPTSATNSSQQNKMAVQIDSLSRSVERLTVRINSEMAANSDRVESFKETTNQLFVLFVVISAVSGALGVIVTVGASRREKQLRADYLSERRFYEERAQKYESQQLDIHGRVLRIYENQAQIGEKYGKHSGEIFNQQESYSRGMAEITATFKDILENIKGISHFKVEESELAIAALQKQAESAQILPQIQQELLELKLERKQQVDGLLQDAVRLIRKRFEYANPDPNLQRQMADFRIKMDSIQEMTLKKYTGADSTEQRDWRYGEIFLRRGIIAYFENDPAKSRDMLKIAETFLPFSDDQLKNMPNEQRIATAFIQFYLALVEKNYDDIRRAQDYIEKSYIARGRDENNELLTPTTRAEILSYAPGGITNARQAIAEILQRVENLKKGGRTLAKHDAICALRVHLILGNTYYLEGKWQQALTHYKNALKEDEGMYYSYYAFHSIAQVLSKLGKAHEAEQMLGQAYKLLLDSRHLETKVALDTRISLNALAYLCTRAKKPKEAAKYRQVIQDYWLRIQDINGLQLRLFSLEQKRQVSKDEFWKELFSA